jgi:SPP1 family predicted phage head-tail adaptor
MSINEFNRRIRVNKYISGQDDSGGNVKSLVEQFDIWAKLENMNGSKYLDNLQITYSKAFKITTRYESTRELISTDEIVYGGLTYSIQSLTQLEEGRKNFNVMIAYTTGTESNTGDIITSPEEDSESIQLNLIAGQDLSSWRVVYINNGTAFYYDPSDTTMPNYAIGITKTAALQNHLIEVQTEGIFEATGLGLTPDRRYYAGVNGVLATDLTGLTVLQEIGHSMTENKLDIQFNSPIITI